MPETIHVKVRSGTVHKAYYVSGTTFCGYKMLGPGQKTTAPVTCSKCKGMR